jgi:hypothetical protein
MRATDILMDRVWQLENETFGDTPGFVFAPITEVVTPEQDPTVLHPEIQRQLSHIRTDLDRFSPLEISSLVRHGYCVGRQACRANPELFESKLPDNPPWDPIPTAHGAALAVSTAVRLEDTSRAATPVTIEARTLQTSATRRIWRGLLDWRDWISYVYVPIIVPLLFLLPLMIVKSYQRSHRLSQLIDSLSQGSRDLQLMTRLLDGPIQPFVGETPEDPPAGEPPDLKGFVVLQDSRILDLRQWKQTPSGQPDPNSLAYGYRRMKVYKPLTFEGSSVFRVHMLCTSPKTQTRFPPQQFKPQLFLSSPKNKDRHENSRLWELNVDLQKLPMGDTADLIYEHFSPGEFLQAGETSTSIAFSMQVDTAEMTRWIMMPEGKEYKNFRLVRYETGKPEKVEPVKLTTEYLADDYTILAYKLLSVKAGYTYELTWYYK